VQVSTYKQGWGDLSLV